MINQEYGCTEEDEEVCQGQEPESCWKSYTDKYPGQTHHWPTRCPPQSKSGQSCPRSQEEVQGRRSSPRSVCILTVIRPLFAKLSDSFDSPQVSSSLFFQYNTALVPPYTVLVDTNFLSHTVQHKLDLLPTMMDCLYAKCVPTITSCVMAELEKLGPKYRIALRIARDERWERLQCDHKGVYADDCIVDRIVKHKIYIVATNDRDLKRRIRKVPGVPIMSVARGRYVIERLPDAPER